jgi:hypothetical protein
MKKLILILTLAIVGNSVATEDRTYIVVTMPDAATIREKLSCINFDSEWEGNTEGIAPVTPIDYSEFVQVTSIDELLDGKQLSFDDIHYICETAYTIYCDYTQEKGDIDEEDIIEFRKNLYLVINELMSDDVRLLYQAYIKDKVKNEMASDMFVKIVNMPDASTIKKGYLNELCPYEKIEQFFTVTKFHELLAHKHLSAYELQQTIVDSVEVYCRYVKARHGYYSSDEQLYLLESLYDGIFLAIKDENEQRLVVKSLKKVMKRFMILPREKTPTIYVYLPKKNL